MQPRRRFTIVDGMVLVAATAFGLAGNRLVISGGMTPFEAITPCLLAWTFAVLALNLLKPKRNFRLLARKFGFIACAVSPVGLLLAANEMFYDYVNKYYIRPPFQDFFFVSIMYDTEGVNGSLVAGSWVALFLCGHRKMRADWLEWLGRVLGLLWVVLLVSGMWLRLL